MSDHLQLRDHSSEARVFIARLWVAAFLVLVLVAMLIARYYTLQVVHHQDYATQSDRNRIHVQPIAPTRGLIYDRNGILLAENRPSYTLSIISELVEDLPATIELLNSLVEISESDLERFERNLAQRRRPFEAIPLRYQLSEEEIARVAVNEFRLKGIEVEAQLVRYYPFKDLFSHSIGYVGRINDQELSSFTEEEYERYRGTFTLGKTGLEHQYEDFLLGQVGYRHVETNARGRVLRELERVDPEPGQDLHLFLDLDIQRSAVEALGEERGAVVAIDVNTGGVLAIASTPGFDPNAFVTGISHQEFRELNESLDTPLFDRALRGQYPAGSTLKPMLAIGGLQQGFIDAHYTISDPGFFRLPNDTRRYRDHIAWGHGNAVDLHQAIVESCNTFYYDLAHRMTIDNLHPLGNQFGLGERTGIDLPGERPGLWPSREWKRGSRGAAWYPGDTLNVGVGQGYVLVTPVQLAVMTATLASRGERRQPQLVNHWREGKTLPPVESIEIEDRHWDSIINAMADVVHSPRGTARRINENLDYRIAGKTGTAQVVGIAQDERYDSEALEKRRRDQALFVGFAPAENPRIAVSVIVENGESAGRTAAPVARRVMDTFFASEQRREALFTHQQR